MRKSELLRQNLELFNELGIAKKEIEMLNNELEDVKKKLEEYKKEQVSVISAEPKTAAPLTAENQSDKINLPDDLKYAADTISKLVVESTKYSNILTANGETRYIELVNLILGKTEVSKSEIVSVTNEKIDINEKIIKMDNIWQKTVEYYESVLAQR